MYPACLYSPVTAGLDGIRLSKGRRIDAQSIYRALCSDNTSGWIYPGYLFRHHVLFTLAMPLAFSYLNTALKSWCSLIIVQTVRAVLLAMATRTTLVGRLVSNSPIQGEGFLGDALTGFSHRMSAAAGRGLATRTSVGRIETGSHRRSWPPGPSR